MINETELLALYLSACILSILAPFAAGYGVMLLGCAIKGLVTGEGVAKATKELREEW
ncbi:hypothetical protein [uncultured Amphritea sp.]|uniref:hypothetical protein n=1 Tax=uncultured Amphritea sp. TaxID=981605 RepID=UPI0026112AC3|nr:hypothetical protein [uncultured Amphritea sp.]